MLSIDNSETSSADNCIDDWTKIISHILLCFLVEIYPVYGGRLDYFFPWQHVNVFYGIFTMVSTIDNARSDLPRITPKHKKLLGLHRTV